MGQHVSGLGGALAAAPKQSRDSGPKRANGPPVMDPKGSRPGACYPGRSDDVESLRESTVGGQSEVDGADVL